MKPYLALAALCLMLTQLTATEITGHVWLDADGDGRSGAGEKPLAGLLVSDGYGFAETDAAGAFRLSLHAKARTLHVLRNDDYTMAADRFWQPLQTDKTTYDFAMQAARKVKRPVILQFCDSETDKLDFLPALRQCIQSHPEISLVVGAGDLANQSSKGLIAHRDQINERTLGRMVAFCCGNHDTDFRGKWEGSPICPYEAILGPWWQAFIQGGFLFVTGPIYTSWGAPVQYDMKDFGDYLKAVCGRFKGLRKVLIVHDLPDLVGYSVASHTGDVNLDDEGFTAVFYGHKHMNIVRRYPSGRTAFSTATPNKGGAGCFAPCFRLTELMNTGGLSRILYWDVENLLDVTTPNGNCVAVTDDNVSGRELTVSVVAYHGTDEIEKVTMRVGDTAEELAACGDMGWSGTLAATDFAAGQDYDYVVEATTHSGRKLTKTGRFTMPTATVRMPLRWVAHLEGTTALAEPLTDGTRLYVGISDDVHGTEGGLRVLETTSGQSVMNWCLGYGIRNTMALDDERLYVIDTRANIMAFDRFTGRIRWTHPSDERIVSPSASGITCESGVVVGGYGRHLRGLDGRSGAVLWRNTQWPVEERTPAEDRLARPGDGTVLVISRLNGLFRHDMRTGKVLWQYKALFMNGTPCIDGDVVWVIGANNELLKLSLATGEKLASTKAVHCWNASSQPVSLDGRRLLVGSADRGLACVDKATLQELWRFLPGKAILTTGDYATGKVPAVTATPVVDGETVLVPCNDGVLYRLEAASGKVLRTFRAGAPLLTKCLVLNDTVYLLDATGRLFAVSSDF